MTHPNSFGSRSTLEAGGRKYTIYRLDSLDAPSGGKSAKLPDYVVLITTLGGIEVFGLNGFVIGPLIAAIFFVSWELFRNPEQGI